MGFKVCFKSDTFSPPTRDIRTSTEGVLYCPLQDESHPKQQNHVRQAPGAAVSGLETSYS